LHGAVSVERPVSARDYDDVRALMRAFLAWHRERHTEDADLIDAYFDDAAFEDELAHVREKYSPPEGDVLLARCDGEAAGCVALRRIDAAACEMKRMFVYPRFHGHGIGRVLGEAVLEAARASGYSVMRLDTSVRQAEAQALYRKLGFREIEPYYELPQALADWLVFMELEL
jgi:putative acetyltransferase